MLEIRLATRIKNQVHLRDSLARFYRLLEIRNSNKIKYLAGIFNRGTVD